MFDGEYLYDKIRKGKKYNYYGNLRFEGEYLYDKFLKGKEYVNNRLEYEGEYLYGRKWNGKGYDENGNIIYELINGTGKGKEYDYKGNLIFEGEYLNGQRNGKGKEYDIEDNLSSKGDYLNGNKWNGNGYDNNNNIVYSLKDGKGLIREYNY